MSGSGTSLVCRNTTSAKIDPNVIESIKTSPTASPPRDTLRLYKTEEVRRAIADGKAMGPDGLPAKLLKFGFAGNLPRSCTTPKGSSSMSERWQGAGGVGGRRCQMPHKKDRIECGKGGGISLAVHAGKFLRIRIGSLCETAGIFPEEQSGFRPERSSTDTNFVARRLQSWVGKKYPSEHMLHRLAA